MSRCLEWYIHCCYFNPLVDDSLPKRLLRLTVQSWHYQQASWWYSTVFVISNCMSEWIKCKNKDRLDYFTSDLRWGNWQSIIYWRQVVLWHHNLLLTNYHAQIKSRFNIYHETHALRLIPLLKRNLLKKDALNVYMFM